MNRKAPFLLIFVIIFLAIGSVAVTTAQDGVYPLLAISSSELDFYAEENGAPQTIELTLVGLAPGEGVDVKIVDAKLYDNSSEGDGVIVNISEDVFDLEQNENKSITLTFDPSGEKAGVYEGVLIITATNKTASAEILTTNIKLTAKIESAPLWYKSVYAQILFVFGAIAPIFVGLAIPDKEVPWEKPKRFKDWLPDHKYSKRFWLVVLGAISVSFWLISIVSLSFTEPGTIINTVLVTPFLTYVISFVKDKRTERLEKEKASRTIRNTGIEKDIELLRSIIGEISTHCASFNPHLYQKEFEFETRTYSIGKHQTTAFDNCYKILFNKSGSLSRKVWDDSRKQGLVADLPILELEKYYDFIEFYNRYYSRALNLLTLKETKDIKPSDIETDKFDFSSFQAFREAYADLESILYAFLTYILGYLSKSYLSPLEPEFRRMSRTLLKKMVDYEILDPKDYQSEISMFLKTDLAEFNIVDEYGDLLTKDQLKEFTQRMTLAQQFKLRIQKYDLTKSELEEIIREIYKRENIELFYRRVSADFKVKYVELKNKCNELKPKIEDSSPTPEKKYVEMSGKVEVVKGQEASDMQTAGETQTSVS